MSAAQAVVLTDKHALHDKQALSYIDRQNEPRILLTDDGFDIFSIQESSRKKCCLPQSLEKKH